MTKITEHKIERFAIELLEGLGYEYVYAPSIAHDGTQPERESYEQVVLEQRLQRAIARINPGLTRDLHQDAYKEVLRLHSPDLLTDNEAFHRLLTEGVKVSYNDAGNDRGEQVWLIDFANPENNDFLVTNQFTVIENNHNKRPDLVLFVNGLPLVVMELKNPASENATVLSAFQQIETYKALTPSLFTYNALSVISDGLEARAGTLSSGFTRYMAWKSADGKAEASKLIGQLETLIKGMLNKSTLLDLIRHFVVFEKTEKEDPKTQVITIETVKKVAAYHQYYAVNRAVGSTLRASGYSSPQAERDNEEVDITHPRPLPGGEIGHRQPLQIGSVTHPQPLQGGELMRSGRARRKIIPYNPKLKERARELRNNMTPPEVRLWNALKQKKMLGFDFDRQRPIDQYIVDFYCKDLMLAIEVDGSSHDHEDAITYDKVRQDRLESLGVHFLRFRNQEVMQDLSNVLRSLETWIEENQHTTPLLGGAGGGSTAQQRESGDNGLTAQQETSESGLITLKSSPPPEGSYVEEPPEAYGVPSVKTQPRGDRKGGVLWHTQGSGKSLSMVFYTGKIVLALNNPTIVLITDRNDLDDQLFDTFAASTQLLRQTPTQAENRAHLKELLRVASGGIVFTTIQKFQPEEGNVYEELSNRDNVIVIADEAHRTQYGFKAKIDKESGAINYGFAKYMRDALPKATYLGFTGTPIEKTDVNTPAVFGNYIDVYDIGQAVEDRATVRIFYESRLAKVQLSEEGKELVKQLDHELQEDELTDNQKAKAKWTQLEALIGSENRVKNIAQDIITHFEQRQEVFVGKGMVVAMSRRIAADLYEAIISLKPDWHSNDIDKGKIKVVMTAHSAEGPKIARHHATKKQRRALAERMRDPKDELQMVVVCNMWLTGFDAPCLHTMYIDKPMKGHNLMQAIARVNRVFGDKPAGHIVDYLGIASDLKNALSFYSDSSGKGDPTIPQEQAVELMLEKIEVVSNMYNRFPYEDYFEADTSKKLSLILAAEDHILSLENGKKRYINEVTALSSAFAIAIPHEQAMDVKDEVAFFQTVKARLSKFTATGEGKTDTEIETTIRQVIDQALVSDQVIDVFDAAGIKKPDISIFSEEFMLEIKGMEHKNVAMEVLKKLLNDEIKARAKTNLIKSKALLEMLEASIRRYHNKIITAAEVIEELIDLSRDITKMDDEAKEMSLTSFEYAFFTAVADNASARDLMEKDRLRELAVVLTQRVRQNASIDWTIKESVRAKLKVIVKRTLRQFGYPPDMQKLATETVLKQAEMIADELTHR